VIVAVVCAFTVEKFGLIAPNNSIDASRTRAETLRLLVGFNIFYLPKNTLFLLCARELELLYKLF
jgi:hypothetical protein